MPSLALISVYDKTGLAPFAQALHNAGYSLVSTGGTYDFLVSEAGVPVGRVSDLTGFPEILDGRVKTLHPRIHGGLLARRDDPEHLSELAHHGIDPIDVVVSNLYPFQKTVANPETTMAVALENIDVGGPSMLRAAAKNFPAVAVVCDPADYGWVADKLANAGLSTEDRRRLAHKAFSHVSDYDNAVASYLAGGDSSTTADAASLPPTLNLNYRKVYDLRYGENPHQKGAFYQLPTSAAGNAGDELLHGKALSFNNIVDADAAWQVVNEFDDTTVAVIKHTNPCGLASHSDQKEAYVRAFNGDTVSAYGGIVGFNSVVGESTARAMRGVFYEVVIAPGYAPEAWAILKRRRSLRVIQRSINTDSGPDYDLRPVTGGLLAQTPDAGHEDASHWKVVTQRSPTDREMRDLKFAWKAAKHVKSNAIVLARDRSLVGMGAGQPNRVTSVFLALRAAGDRAKGSVLASDAFFPFADNVTTAADGGVSAIIQPGGSIRDEESIEAANAHGIAMVFTGTRHFRH